MAKEYLEVYFIRNYQHEGEEKSHWTRIGTAFQNEDSSYNVLLDLMPLPDRATGQVHLHIRLPRSKDYNFDEMSENISFANSAYPIDDDL